MLSSKINMHEEFPLTSRCSYLNTAARGLVPRRTIEAMQAYWAKAGSPAEQPESTARETVADFIGAAPEEVMMVPNTSYGLSVAAAALPLERGAEVLIPAWEFPSVPYAFLNEAQHRDLVVRFVEWDQYGPTLEQIEDAFTDRTRVLALSWVQYLNGYTHDLAALSAMCRRHGAFLVVDAIQGLGSVPLDVRADGIDVLSAGSYKWLLAGSGAGVFYVRKEILPQLQPRIANFRGMDVHIEDPEYRLAFRDGVGKFKLGSRNRPGEYALETSIKFIMSVGVERIHEHTRKLANLLAEGLRSSGYKVNTRPGEIAPIVAFTTGSREGDEELLGELNKRGVIGAIRGLGIRLGVHLYTTEEDIARVLHG